MQPSARNFQLPEQSRTSVQHLLRHARADGNSNTDCCPLHQVGHLLLPRLHRTLQGRPSQRPACEVQERVKVHAFAPGVLGEHERWA